jgi:hypothetical protein
VSVVVREYDPICRGPFSPRRALVFRVLCRFCGCVPLSASVSAQVVVGPAALRTHTLSLTGCAAAQCVPCGLYVLTASLVRFGSSDSIAALPRNDALLRDGEHGREERNKTGGFSRLAAWRQDSRLRWGACHWGGWVSICDGAEGASSQGL